MYRLVLCLLALLLPGYGFAAESISCHFNKWHQTKHASPHDLSSTDVNQSLEIIGDRTTPETLSLDGQKRATNSDKWIRLRREGWETFGTHYIGDFGELLTISHELGENLSDFEGWYTASLIGTSVKTTQTLTGMCLVRKTTQ